MNNVAPSPTASLTLSSSRSGLSNTLCSHVHIGMAPHGEALQGEDLEEQMSTTIGGPDFFWAAEFEFLDPSKGC